MKIVLLLMAICVVIVGAAIAASYALNTVWPIPGAGWLLVILFKLFNVADRFDRAIETVQDDQEKRGASAPYTASCQNKEKGMFANLKDFFRQQRATAWFFVMALCWLLLSITGCVVELTRGHTIIGTILSVVVLACVYLAWMLGVAVVAAARTLRTRQKQL